jgi:hypothetical protein
MRIDPDDGCALHAPGIAEAAGEFRNQEDVEYRRALTGWQFNPALHGPAASTGVLPCATRTLLATTSHTHEPQAGAGTQGNSEEMQEKTSRLEDS